MKLSLPIIFGLVLLAIASSASGDTGILFLYYDDSDGNLPLGTPCASPRVPFPDGTPISLYWDNDHNGPTPNDVQPEIGILYGQANVNSFTFNGTAQGLGAGYFAIDPQLTINELPFSDVGHPGDTALYYLQVNHGNRCWRTPVFRILPGSNDRTFRDLGGPVDMAWTCVDEPCPTSGNPPSAPTNCNASDDTRCLSVQVTWQHDGLNVSGFNVYTDTTFIVSVGPASRSATFDVFTEAVRPYHVKAYNGAGESNPSNTNDGSGYLLRFVDGPQGNISGFNLHGTTHTLMMERPTPQCYSAFQIWLLVNNVRHTLLLQDSIRTSATITLPDDTTLYNCRILLADSSLRLFVVVPDTTDSVFHLGRPSAAEIHANLTPDRFELAQNFPNPFNPETDIMFSVPTTAAVRIQVYNIMGQLIRTLTDASYTAGVHRIHWDGRTDAGLTAGAGVYIYRMEAPGFIQAKKMLLMK